MLRFDSYMSVYFSVGILQTRANNEEAAHEDSGITTAVKMQRFKYNV